MPKPKRWRNHITSHGIFSNNHLERLTLVTRFLTGFLGSVVKGRRMTLSRPAPPRDAYARYSVLEYLLIGDLRDLLEESPDNETRRWLLAILEELLDLLPNEFEYEDQGGYLAEVCEQNPNWSNVVERLHREHENLYFNLLELRNRISSAQSFDFIADEVKPKLSRWIEAAQRHRESEQQLVVSSYDTTFGGEG